jgi:O-antigen ligase
MNKCLKKLFFNTLLEDCLRWQLYLIVFTIVFSLRLNTNLIIIYCLLALIVFLKERKVSIDWKFSTPFLVYFIWLIFGLTYGENLSKGLFILEKNSLFLITPVFFFTFKFNQIVLRRIFLFFIGSNLIALIFCLSVAVLRNYFEYVEINADSFYFNPWFYSNILFASAIPVHPTYFSLYLICSISIIFFFIYKKPSSRITWFVFISLFFMLGIIMLASRVVMLCFLILLFYFVVKVSEGSIKKGINIFIVIFAVFSVVFVVLINTNSLNKRRYLEPFEFGNSLSEERFGGRVLRFKMWEAMLEELIYENLIFGLGTGDNQGRLNEAYRKHEVYPALKNSYGPHSLYLSIIINNGLVGLLLYFNIIYRLILFARKEKQTLTLLLLFIFSTVGLTESVLSLQKGIVFFHFIAFLIYNMKSPEKMITYEM